MASEQESEKLMIWKKLKITVEQKPFQRDWLEKGKKQILGKPLRDFPLNGKSINV